jgi:ribosomal protein L9
MKVILTASSKLGKIGDIVVVKNGYAKNFLIPNKKAIFYFFLFINFIISESFNIK